MVRRGDNGSVTTVTFEETDGKTLRRVASESAANEASREAW